MPALEVPKAAPTAIIPNQRRCHFETRPAVKKRTAKNHLLQSKLNSFFTRKDVPLTADATPANPKKGAKGGQRDIDRYEG